MRNIFQIGAISALAVVLLFGTASAQVSLTYGINNEIELLENTANQRVDIFANNVAGSDFDTFEMFVQIGDGGALAGGTDVGPGLSGVDLGESGTIFEGGNRGAGLGDSQTPLLWADFIDGVVATNDGVVGTLIFDTTGFFAGSTLDIQFTGIDIGGTIFDTVFQNADETVVVAPSSNGVVRVVSAVPEPSSVIVVLAMTGILGLRRRR